MKKIFLLFLVLTGFGLQAQEATEVTPNRMSDLFSRFSITATAGTSGLDVSNLSNISTNQLTEIGLSEMTIAYKVNPRFSLGVSTMNNLSNGNAGYYDAENQFFSFCDDDDDLDDDDDGEDHDDDDDECDDDFGGNLLGSATFKLSEKLPFFIQAAGGYSLNANAPVYTAKIGYAQKIVAGFGVSAGIRFSDVLYNKPATAVTTTNSSALKAELGINWNF